MIGALSNLPHPLFFSPNTSTRLFMQPQTDDAQHDTALSNRVAALNLLDLTLEHLDIQISEASSISEINNIVRACGQRQYQKIPNV
jgi:hypothetical protein